MRIYRVELLVDLGGRTSDVALRMIADALHSPGVRQADFGSTGIREDPERGHLMDFELMAEGDDEVEPMLQSVKTSLEARGVRCGAGRMVIREYAPRAPNIPGLIYDEGARRLTVDTWAPDHANLEMHLHSRSDGEVGMILATITDAGRTESALIVREMIVRRQGG